MSIEIIDYSSTSQITFLHLSTFVTFVLTRIPGDVLAGNSKYELKLWFEKSFNLFAMFTFNLNRMLFCSYHNIGKLKTKMYNHQISNKRLKKPRNVWFAYNNESSACRVVLN